MVGLLRQRILTAALVTACALALCGSTPLHSQATPPVNGPPPFAVTVSNGPSDSAKPNPPQISQPAVDATSLGSPQALTKQWRVGITDDVRAALPEFDDSAWAVRDAQPSINEVPEPDDHEQPASASQGGPRNAQRGPRRYAWFRLHLRLAPNHGPLALFIELPVSHNTTFGFIAPTGPTVEVFANGRQIQPEGPHGSDPQHYEEISRIYDLNVAPDETSLTLVLRTIYVPFGFNSYTNFFASRTLYLGHRNDLQAILEQWLSRNLFERLPRLVYSILLTVLALFLFALYFAQKGHIEYLWLALHELVQAPIGFVEQAGSAARLDKLWYAAIVLQLVLVSAYFFFEFIVAFLSLPRSRYIRLLRYTAPILALVAPTLLQLGRGAAAIVVLSAIVSVCSILWMVGWLIFIFSTLIKAARRRNFEAGLLLIPLVLSLVGIIEPIVTASMRSWVGVDYRSPLTIMTGPIPIHFASIADFTGILVIIVIIFGRFLRIQRDRERVTNELEAARNVQELMIPREKLATPGFEVESIYDPAHEVGGDFFHVHTEAGGGMLVVIGDVAGKGLKAAMNVSMLMGALRGTKEHSPAKILTSLNSVLTGSESFTTCMAAWFGPDGDVVLANAGHLPPYLNSQEVTVPGGLPLGVIPEVSYEEVSLYLHPGDRLLLLSDGVVEARRPSGELFGFDRVRNLSNQSVFYIADAAKTFGQEDDITVLTVRRLARTMAA